MASAVVSVPSQLASDSSSAPATSSQPSSSFPAPPPTSSSLLPPSPPPPTSTTSTTFIPPPTSQNTSTTTFEQPPPSSSPSSSSSTSTTNAPSPIASSPSSAPQTAIAPSSSSPPLTVPLSTVIGVTNGQTYTSVVQVTITQTSSSTSTSAATNAGSSSSDTGAIVGGVVGGIVGLSALVLLVWFILRKRRQDREDLFDGNFDPAHVVSAHNRDNRFDLDDEDQSATGAPGITPYPYQPLQMSQHQNSARPSTDQRPLIPPPVPATGFYANNLTSAAAYSAQNGNASSWHGHGSPPTTDGEYTSSFASRGGARSPPIAVYPVSSAQGPSPGPSIPPSEIGSSGHGHSNSIGSGSMGGSTQRMSAKDREAFGNAASSSRLTVSNATEGEPLMSMSMPIPMAYPYSKQLQQQQQQYQRALSSSPPLLSSTSPVQSEKGATTPTRSSVIVHQDGGRLPDENGADEIPPTYDSLPKNDRR